MEVHLYAPDSGEWTRPTYWIGLDERGAPCIDAAMERAETDHPGYFAQDWSAA